MAMMLAIPGIAGAGQQTQSPAAAQQQPPQPERPLNPTQEIAGEEAEGNALAVGPAQLRIGGFLGLTGLYRSTNSGGGPGTAFANTPYDNSVEGNVSETRLTAETSKLSVRVDASFPEPGERFRKLAGYFEMDFSGNAPGNVAVTASSFTLRMRHAFAEVQYGDSVFLSIGQAFTLMTPVKDQLSTWPSDVELTQAVDTNYVAGMVWARLPQVRVTWRPSKRFNWAASVENPEQQIGKRNRCSPCVLLCRHHRPVQHRLRSAERTEPDAGPDDAGRDATDQRAARRRGRRVTSVPHDDRAV
jgi:hypothetical protein